MYSCRFQISQICIFSKEPSVSPFLTRTSLPDRTTLRNSPPVYAEVYSSHDCQNSVQLFRYSFWTWLQSRFPASFVKVSRLQLPNYRAMPRYSSVRHIPRLYNGKDTKAPWPTTCSCCKSLTSLVHGNECQCRHALSRSRSTVAVERHRFGSH